MNWIIVIGAIGFVISLVSKGRAKASERRISEQQAAIMRAKRAPDEQDRDKQEGP
jgi:uncharacterized membrane protein YsdA (DUF1294 family)